MIAWKILAEMECALTLWMITDVIVILDLVEKIVMSIVQLITHYIIK